MSVFQPRALPCPRCGFTNVETVALSLHGPRVREVVDAIRDGSFQVFRCGSCREEYRADGPLIYVDFDQKHWIGTFPASDERSWALLEQQPLDSFRRALVDHAPRFVRERSHGFVVRCVFGLDALAEKLTVIDAGADDRLVELAKFAVALANGGMVHPGHRPRVVGRDPANGLRMQIWRTGTEGSAEPLLVDVSDDELVRRGADPAWRPVIDELTAGPYVDVGRLFFDGRAPLTPG